MDYSEYDLLDEFTIRQVSVAYTKREDGSCDGNRARLIKDALIHAIKNNEVVSTVHTDNRLSEKYLTNDMPLSAIEWGLTEVRIQRNELIKWFESKDQKPAFLFKEGRNGEGETQQLSDKERENLLRAIGLLSRVLADTRSSARLGTPDKPNVSQIVELLLTHLQNYGLPGAGLAKSTMSERITAGLKLLQKR